MSVARWAIRVAHVNSLSVIGTNKGIFLGRGRVIGCLSARGHVQLARLRPQPRYSMQIRTQLRPSVSSRAVAERGVAIEAGENQPPRRNKLVRNKSFRSVVPGKTIIPV